MSNQDRDTKILSRLNVEQKFLEGQEEFCGNQSRADGGHNIDRILCLMLCNRRATIPGQCVAAGMTGCSRPTPQKGEVSRLLLKSVDASSGSRLLCKIPLRNS